MIRSKRQIVEAQDINILPKLGDGIFLTHQSRSIAAEGFAALGATEQRVLVY